MQQVRIQKRPKRIVTLGAIIAASALLSAFQPASAQDLLETAWASARVQQGDFDIWFSVQEHSGGQVCANITNVVSGEYHFGCGSGFDVEVSDTLDSAWGAGTAEWTVYSASKGRGSKAEGPKSGTITVDTTWVGSGDLKTNLHPGGDPLNPLCWISIEGGGCRPYVDADQTRAATASGTVTDSEWGTFVIEGAIGSMWQRLI